MRKNMKLIGLAVCLTCCAGFINAQEANEPQERQQEKRLPREVLNPEKVATQMTDQMNKLLQLTDKQYKKNIQAELERAESILQGYAKFGWSTSANGRRSWDAGRTPTNGWRPTAYDERRWFSR